VDQRARSGGTGRVRRRRGGGNGRRDRADRLDAEGGLTAHHVEAIAATLARFHREGCARAPADSPWGSPEKVWQPVAQNFAQIASRLDDPADRQGLDALWRWSETEHASSPR